MTKPTYDILRHISVLHDCPMPQGDRPIQIAYFNDVSGLFMKTFAKLYSTEPLSELDRANLLRYLEKMIEAKAVIGENPTL
ncbi:MAG: hypothetical protein WC763_02155 [Candidatus Paceibacterota bacterium]|jgi:hypothetical protein